ncbi:MAG: D-lyxose/D-mannose family sugar isomerase [Armatimonadetes bacterium]|nr:D-lyxose/D-mannose family sugar isomerase [Armatimonadota bacterium]
MKRSQINAVIEEAKRFCEAMSFHLPPFAFWTPGDWQCKGHEYDEIRDNRLGWDITDFGSDDFEHIGLVLFTIRNGNARAPEKYAKPYCEKIIIVREGQVCPDHHHRSKMEDIINRGGGNLILRLQNASPAGELLDTPVTVSMDGRRVTLAAGCEVRLRPGESITLPPFLHHRFWGEEGTGTVLCGEVSTVNDDETDNVFIPEVPRFARIEEDVPPVHLLCNEYPPAPD